MRAWLIGLLVVLAVTLAIPAGAAEFRGLYVDAFHTGFKSPEQTAQMVAWAYAANFNALIVQVRKRGDAYYNSSIEPRATDIEGAGYDPLADIVQQAHDAGLEVYAWLSVLEVSYDSRHFNPSAGHVSLVHPEWLMKTKDGNSVFYKGKVFVDPGIPEVQDNFSAIVQDILGKYDVDGIHLDNLAYPANDGGYSSTSVARFNSQYNREGIPAQDDAAWCQWRRDQITGLVGKVKAAVVSAKPSAKLSVSVLRSAQVASDIHLQQWEGWNRDHLVDFLTPMVFITSDTMSARAADLLPLSYDRHMYIGIGTFQLGADAARRQITDARAAGAKGVVLFSYHYLGPNSNNPGCVKGNDLISMVFTEPASLPAMPWRD